MNEKVVSVVFCGVGFLAGSLIGVACGWLIGNEMAVVVGYSIGAIAGVAVAARLFKRLQRAADQ